MAALDGNGLACLTLPAGSLAGQIALILRGTCTFESKVNNAQRAGAVAALVYAAQAAPSPFVMGLGAATLPAEMVSYDDGVAIKQSLASQPSLIGTMQFSLAPVPVPGGRLTDFTAAGPSVDLSIKPDLTAVGQDIYVATETLDSAGDMYDPSGYILVDGTSFSSPLVAGTAALLKSARPGLTVDQYRSLLINTASPAQTTAGGTPGIQQAGAGILDAQAALHSPVTAYPTSLSFGAGGTDPSVSQVLHITNVGAAAETFVFAATGAGGAPVPAAAAGTVDLDPGAYADVPVSWNASGLAAGTYEGALTVTALSSGTQIHVPYWYAVTSGTPARITVLDSITSARRASVQQDAVLFRVTDASGVVLPDVQPQVTVVSGGGTVGYVSSYDADVPGVFGITLRLGFTAGTNVFRIQVGTATVDVSITGA